jgi:hypothetical protein
VVWITYPENIRISILQLNAEGNTGAGNVAGSFFICKPINTHYIMKQKKEFRKKNELKHTKKLLSNCKDIGNPYEDECMMLFGYQREYKGQIC